MSDSNSLLANSLVALLIPEENPRVVRVPQNIWLALVIRLCISVISEAICFFPVLSAICVSTYLYNPADVMPLYTAMLSMPMSTCMATSLTFSP